MTETPVFDQLASEADFDVEATLARDCTYATWKSEFDAGWPERWTKLKPKPRKTAAKRPRRPVTELPTEDFTP